MVDTASLRLAFGRIGLNPQTQEALVLQGLVTINDLSMFRSEDMIHLCKAVRSDAKGRRFPVGEEIMIPYVHQQKLEAMVYWAKEQMKLGITLSANDFTARVANQIRTKMMTDADEKLSRGSTAPTLPEKFLKATQWTIFREAFTTYLGNTKGANNVELSYLIRPPGAPVAGIAYADERERAIAITPHSGDAHQRDAIRLWDILKPLVLEGPAWHYIVAHDKRKNGPAAWDNIIAHFDGDASMTRFKASAYASLQKAAYTGKSKHFTFEQYVTLHQKAHAELARLEEAIPENKKVRDFLEGITCPRLEQAKLYVLGSPTHLMDFTATANYISQVSDTVNQYQGPGRQISSATTDGGRGGGRGRGRGRGRGGGRGGGGRGGGRGAKGGSSNYLPYKEWMALSEEEKNKRREKRDATTKRDVSKVASEAEDAEDNSPISDDAGLQFGRKGKKKKDTP